MICFHLRKNVSRFFALVLRSDQNFCLMHKSMLSLTIVGLPTSVGLLSSGVPNSCLNGHLQSDIGELYKVLWWDQ